MPRYKCETKKGVLKVCYKQSHAVKMCRKLEKENGVPFSWYKCSKGNHFHIGNSIRRKHQMKKEVDNNDMYYLLQDIDDTAWEGIDNNESMITFFALREYLGKLVNNGGRIQRIVKVTHMINQLYPEVKEYVLANFAKPIADAVKQQLNQTED